MKQMRHGALSYQAIAGRLTAEGTPTHRDALRGHARPYRRSSTLARASRKVTAAGPSNGTPNRGIGAELGSGSCGLLVNRHEFAGRDANNSDPGRLSVPNDDQAVLNCQVIGTINEFDLYRVIPRDAGQIQICSHAGILG